MEGVGLPRKRHSDVDGRMMQPLREGKKRERERERDRVNFSGTLSFSRGRSLLVETLHVGDEASNPIAERRFSKR